MTGVQTAVNLTARYTARATATIDDDEQIFGVLPTPM